MRGIKKALDQLEVSNIPVERRDYGFRIMHPDLPDRGFMECGMDNDSSISISVHTEEDPPGVWFFRLDFLEIAELIIAAYAATKKTDPSRADIVAAMRKVDAGYDYAPLNKMVDEFLGGLDDEA